MQKRQYRKSTCPYNKHVLSHFGKNVSLVFHCELFFIFYGAATSIHPAILSLSHHQRKRGSWGCQECDVLIGTNLQICNPPNYFIVLSGKHCSSEARQARKSRNLALLSVLETKGPRLERQYLILGGRWS